MQFRYSDKPAKQLLWYFLMGDMRLSVNYEIGIDAGCGHMENKGWFKTQRYIGIDVDQDRLDLAQANHSDAEIINAKIEEITGLVGDIVLCVQVMNNRYFDVENTYVATKALIEMVRPGGVLIFNISRKAFKFEEEILMLLERSFDTIKVRKYGALSAIRTVFSPLIAGLMYIFPFLRKGLGYQKIYYVCKGRR